MSRMHGFALAVAAAVLTVSTAYAQDDAAINAAINGALLYIKDLPKSEQTPATPLTLEGHRRTLVMQRERALKSVVDLLDLPDVTIRLNAAIVLAGMSGADDTRRELLAALKRCQADSNPGVSHWGLVGILGGKFPPADAGAALQFSLHMQRSITMRLSALQAVAANTPKDAVPVLYEHMRQLLPVYEQQLSKAIAGIYQRGAPGQNLSTEATELAKQRPVLDKLTADQQELIIKELLAVPAVQELQLCGIIMDARIKSDFPQDPAVPFKFDSTAPWNLMDNLVEAGKWLAAHQTEYPPALPPAPPPAPPEFHRRLPL